MTTLAKMAEGRLSNYQELPTLYTVDSKGKPRQWTITALGLEDRTATIRTVHGLVGGKLITSEKKVKKAVSQDTPFLQALFNARSAWKKKYDLGARKSIEEAKAVEVILPMLAETYKEGKGRFPAYAQPKIDGVRCLCHLKDGKLNFISRKNKRYNESLQHLVGPLMMFFQRNDLSNAILDGEIYNHDMSLQKISGLARGYTHGESEKLQFWIYDTVAKATNYKGRKALLDKFFSGDVEGPLVKVPTLAVKSHEEFVRYHDKWVELGFEGAILRHENGLYRLGLYRSPDLLKFKNFIDHEFGIIGGKEAEGVQEGCVIFRVKGVPIDRDGNKGHEVEFDVNPRGSHEWRREVMKDLQSYIEKPLTVRYFDLTDDGQPWHPVGINVRDEWS